MRPLLLSLFCLCAATQLSAQTFPPNFSRVVVNSTAQIQNPTAMAFTPDGRLFVCQQNGVVRVIKNDELLTTPFIDLDVSSTGERGLIGIAIDPDFSTNNYLYLYYTVVTTPLHNRVSRFTAQGDVVMAGSEQVLLELDNIVAENHNGGAMAFGPDGKLYIATGENAVPMNAQNFDNTHGKLLRINKDGTAPTDNPFPSGSASRQRIWAMGLRNPFTFAFQPGTGKLFVNDVGQDFAEEINDATVPGRNFGWPTSEGTATNPQHTSPFYFYTQSGPTLCAIVGGTFFNPTTTNYPPEYIGKYFFMDLCGAWIQYIDPTQSSPTAVSFGSAIGNQSLAITTGPDGNLYYLSRINQRVYKVVYTPPGGAPQITAQPQAATVFAGQQATFTVTATGTAPLGYQWQKDNVNIPGATQATLTLNNVQSADAGNYRVVVSNVSGTTTSNAVLLTVSAPPSAPLIITQPASRNVVAGTSVSFNVVATGTAPLFYQWRKNGVALSGATSSTYTIASVVAADAGNYSVEVSNSISSVISNEAGLVVRPPNTKPVADILTPTTGTTYIAGTTISFSGTATDAEDGTLAANAYTWAINFHHDTHQHDQPVLTDITSGSFAVPTRGEVAANVWYRIILTVVDSEGDTGKDSIDIHPLKSTISFRTQPPGLAITLDGQPLVTPADIQGVEGMLRDIDVPAGQVQGGVTYNFASWSNNGTQAQTLTTPTDDLTLTAVFAPVLSAGESAETTDVYPVPASTVIYIRGSNIGGAVATDMLGRSHRLQPVAIGAHLSSVDISHLNEGTFVVQFRVGQQVVKKRMVIAR